MKRKILSMLLLLVMGMCMLFGFVACNDVPPPEQPPEQNQPEQSPVQIYVLHTHTSKGFGSFEIGDEFYSIVIKEQHVMLELDGDGNYELEVDSGFLSGASYLEGDMISIIGDYQETETTVTIDIPEGNGLGIEATQLVANKMEDGEKLSVSLELQGNEVEIVLAVADNEWKTEYRLKSLIYKDASYNLGDVVFPRGAGTIPDVIINQESFVVEFYDDGYCLIKGDYRLGTRFYEGAVRMPALGEYSENGQEISITIPSDNVWTYSDEPVAIEKSEDGSILTVSFCVINDGRPSYVTFTLEKAEFISSAPSTYKLYAIGTGWNSSEEVMEFCKIGDKFGANDQFELEEDHMILEFDGAGNYELTMYSELTSAIYSDYYDDSLGDLESGGGKYKETSIGVNILIGGSNVPMAKVNLDGGNKNGLLLAFEDGDGDIVSWVFKKI